MEKWNWETDGVRVPPPAAEFVWVWVAENDGWAPKYYLPTHPFN